MPSRRVPPEQRKRTEISCDRCKHRKQKCQKPPDQPESAACKYCATHGFDCQTTHRPKPRFSSSAEGVGARISLLESLVKGLMPEADTSSLEGMRALGSTLGIPLPPPPPPSLLPSSSSGGAALGGRSASGAAMGLDQEAQSEHGESIAAGEGRREEGRQTDSPTPGKDDEVPVLRDQQGQTQYIGPASSYLFQIKIRALFGPGPKQPQGPGQFFLFGRNPMDKAWVQEVSALAGEMARSPAAVVPGSSEASATPGSESGVASTNTDVGPSPIDSILASPVPDTLISAYFDHIHADFPVLHEASFREEYERYALSPNLLTSTAEPPWICSLLCVLILARRTVGGADMLTLSHGQEAEERWWKKVQALLPSVLFTSSLSAVQALLLAALHLHNTNHRDACWTLLGSAARIAFAIGLHKDSMVGANKKPLHPPIIRELRKRIFWTLYTFEMMQASSLDRPSAIDDAVCTAGCPRESILGTGSGGGDACMLASSRLVVMLSQACRVIRSLTGDDNRAFFTVGPLSPAAALLRDLTRWKQQLPSHLRTDAIDGLAPTGRRAILLLHIQYNYVLSVLSRNALLGLAAKLSTNEPPDGRQTTPTNNILPPPIPSGPRDAPVLSDVCIESAQKSCQLLLRLDADDLFDPISWLDMYYIYSAALVLVLSIICEVKRFCTFELAAHHSHWLVESRRLLQACADLCGRHLQNPMIPGTLHRYAIVICDLNNMISEEYVRGKSQAQAQETDDLPEPSSAMDVDPASATSIAPIDHHHPQQALQGSVLGSITGFGFAQNPPSTDPSPYGLGDGGFHQIFNANAAFPDATWPWQEGQWNDIAGILLGSDFPGH